MGSDIRLVDLAGGWFIDPRRCRVLAIAVHPLNEAEAFRDALERLGLSQSSLARLLHELGDPRSVPTILRSVANWCRGIYAVPGEMWVVIRLLDERRDQRTSSAA